MAMEGEEGKKITVHGLEKLGQAAVEVSNKETLTPSIIQRLGQHARLWRAVSRRTWRPSGENMSLDGVGRDMNKLGHIGIGKHSCAFVAAACILTSSHTRIGEVAATLDQIVVIGERLFRGYENPVAPLTSYWEEKGLLEVTPLIKRGPS